MRGAPDVLGVQLGGVVVPERGLDAALGFGRVTGLQRPLGGKRDPRAGALGRERGGETRGAAPDHEHIE